MSQAFASKHGQHVVNLDSGKFCISAAGNQIATNQVVRDVHIALEGRDYAADLVILPGLGIDVILGMNWMSKHGVLIDTSTRVVMLREPVTSLMLRTLKLDHVSYRISLQSVWRQC